MSEFIKKNLLFGLVFAPIFYGTQVMFGGSEALRSTLVATPLVIVFSAIADKIWRRLKH